ncbi:MAG: hypothetical protein JW771_07225 [Candidatus Thermoplasmatota archaeon]|nr:hypothetical protein [Candidatus Thermoplasmatota archaeon]
MITKTVGVFLLCTLLCCSLFSGCILDQLFGTTFSWTSWECIDDEGFPSILLDCSCSGTVTLELYDPGNALVDNEFFLRGNHEAVLHLAAFHNPIAPGHYTLKVYDSNDQNIFEKTFSFNQGSLTISSVEPYWWKEKGWSDTYSLIGLQMTVHNTADSPIYPYTIEATVDEKIVHGQILPTSMLQEESNTIDAYLYLEDASTSEIMTLTVTDKEGNLLGSGAFPLQVSQVVSTTSFNWEYEGTPRRITLPYPPFLYNYYSSIDRNDIRHEDYALYVFDEYDDNYLELFVDQLQSGLVQSQNINAVTFAASFVQHLDYKLDSKTNDSFEYPRFPIETLFNGEGGGDCEDKAILLAAILDQMGYEAALFRLTGHMAVGVQLDEDATAYDYYIDNYYYIETTNERSPCGFVPQDYRDKQNLSVYEISSRPLLLQNWKNGTVSIFKQTELGDFVKATVIVKNMGSDAAEDIVIRAAFYNEQGVAFSSETTSIATLPAGSRKKVVLRADIPPSITTQFKTQIYLDNDLVDERETASSFP